MTKLEEIRRQNAGFIGRTWSVRTICKKKQIEFEVKSKENINTLLVYMN